MKKGVILEHKSRSTIIMTKDGEFVKAQKISGADIGEEVPFEPKPAPSLGFFTYKKRSAATIAIIFIFSLFPAYFWYGDNKAYAYINIDINPSFEAKVNHNLEIISMEALNEDGESLLKNLEGWKGEQLTSVTSQLFEAVKEEGLLSNGERALVGVSYLSGQGDLDIINKVQGFFDQQEDSLQVAAYTVPYEWKKEAEKSGESVHAVVNRHITENQQAIDLEEDARKLIHSFFQEEEKKQKETEPLNKDKEEKDSKDTKNKMVNEPAPEPQEGTSEKQKAETPDQQKPAVEPNNGSTSGNNTSTPSSENGKKQNHSNNEGKPASKKDKKPASKKEQSPPPNSNSSGSKEQGPPEKSDNHPGNKGKGHSKDKGNGPPSEKNEKNHPGDKKKENPSSTKKKDSKENRNKNNGNGKGNGPPQK